MIYCKELDKNFESKEDMLEMLHKNKSEVLSQKKAQVKHADAISFISLVGTDKGKMSFKANEPFIPESDKFKVKVVINTTNIMDSHMDVHIPGLWNKSLKENKDMLHLQEHIVKFANVISSGNDLKAFTKKFSFSELGFSFDGDTEALVFESEIKEERNKFMFEQYSKGYVTQHSVGMRYIKIVMCVNSDKEYYGAEKEAWDKYYPMVANKEEVDKYGYFWAVKEAKVIEGSAVVLGSNSVTPTLDNNLKSEPSLGAQNEIEPSKDTQKEQRDFYINLLNQ